MIIRRFTHNGDVQRAREIVDQVISNLPMLQYVVVSMCIEDFTDGNTII